MLHAGSIVVGFVLGAIVVRAWSWANDPRDTLGLKFALLAVCSAMLLAGAGLFALCSWLAGL